jgi:predicted methyltransferase
MEEGMTRVNTLLIAAAVLSVALLAWLAAAADTVPAAVAAAVKDPGRPPTDMAKDLERSPGEVVAFAGVKVGDKVVDLIPGNGYYTRILSKTVGPKGKVYPYVPIIGNAQQTRAREREALAKGETPPINPVDQVLAIQNIQPEYSNVMVLWQNIAALGLPEQVDVVFVADAYHRVRNKEFGNVEAATISKAVFLALKSGGLFYVVDDEASAGAARDDASAAGFAVDGTARTIGKQVAYRFKKPTTAVGDNRPKGDPLKTWYGNTFTLGPITERFRTIFHHPDGTYHEFGMNDMQSGYSYWSADGRNCMLHQFPIEQRGFVTCHQYPVTEGTRTGTMWIEGGPNHLAPYFAGQPRPAPGQGNVVGLTEGLVYPNVVPPASR